MNILNFMPKVIAIENDFCLRTSAIWQFVGYGLFALKILVPLIIIIFGIVDFAKAIALVVMIRLLKVLRCHFLEG